MNIENRKAKFDYHFLETYVSGICLLGSEVKSIRDHKISMVDSFCFFLNGELWIKNLDISPSKNSFQHDPKRDKKLLLKKSELKKISKSLVNGITIVPRRIFTNEKNIIKIEISVAKGKKNYDKKESLKERDIARETSSYLKDRNKY